MKSSLRLVVFVFFLTVLLCMQVFGQSTQMLNMQVRDSLSGEPLFGATVSIKKHRHLHISDENGRVHIDSLMEGDYFVHVSYVGYHHQDLKVHIPSQGLLQVLLCSEMQHLHENIVLGEGNAQSFSGRSKVHLSAEEINKRQGQNISELLKDINGVTVQNSSGGIAKPVIRGMLGQRLVNIQGNAKMEGQQWGDDHGPELDPFQANAIEVIKGSAALEYGPEAIGGAIRILPKPWMQDTGWQGNIAIQGLSNSKQGAGSLTLEGRKGTKKYFAWRAQASGRKAGDAHAPDYQLSNTAFVENAQSVHLVFGLEKWKWESGISRFYSKQGILAASHLGNTDDLKAAIQAEKPLIILPFTYHIGKPYQEVQHILFYTQWTYQIDKNSNLFLLYNQQVNRRLEFDADRTYNQALQGRAAMDLEIQSFQSEQRYERKFKDHWAMRLGSTQMIQQNTVAGTQFIIPAFQAFSAGAYAIFKKDWIDGDISFGMRYDLRNLEVPEFKRFQKIYAYQRFFSGPTAGITYNRKFEKNLLASLSLQSGWRPPAVNELYSYGLHYGIASFEMGDSLLKPERSYLLDFNLKKSFKHWVFDLSVYAQFFKYFIYRTPLPLPVLTIRGAFPAFQFTQQNAQLLGAEASLVYQQEKAWQWSSRFTYLYAQNSGLNQPLLWMPANRTDHTLTYLFSDRKRMKEPFLELQGIAVARQYRYISGSDFITPPKGYILFHLNAGMAMKVFPKGKPWRFSLSCQNLLNQNYRDYQSRFRYFANDPGFNFIARIQIPL